MNARVFLLILVTGAFMAIWNSDHEAMQAALAKRQKLSQTEIAVHAPDADLLKTSAELFSHDETEWQAFLETTRSIEVTAQDVADAEEVEVIELNAGSEPLHSATVSPGFEPEIQVVAPEDLCLEVPVAKSIVSQEPKSNPATPTELELRHAAVHLVNPVLASIEDAIDEHDELAVEHAQSDKADIAVSDEQHEVAGSVDPQTAEHESDEQGGSEVAETHSETKPVTENHEPSHETAPLVVTAEKEHSSADSTHDTTESSETIQPVLPVEGPTIPLPANLANGTWQVVDAVGRSFRITIDRTSAKNGEPKVGSDKPGDELEEHFCIRTSASGERWCFIRSYETATPAKRVATEFFSPTQTMPDRQ